VLSQSCNLIMHKQVPGTLAYTVSSQPGMSVLCSRGCQCSAAGDVSAPQPGMSVLRSRGCQCSAAGDVSAPQPRMSVLRSRGCQCSAARDVSVPQGMGSWKYIAPPALWMPTSWWEHFLYCILEVICLAATIIQSCLQMPVNDHADQINEKHNLTAVTI
jgi:hypothetical protein